MLIKNVIHLVFCIKIIAFLCLSPHLCRSQPLYFDYLTIKEGLPHNTVYSIAQDNFGYIWLGTHNGLVRYDGYDFRSYQRVKNKNSQELIIRSVHALLLDTKGKMWIGTDSDGLFTYDTHSGEWAKINDSQAIKSRINTIFEDRKGNIWIATMGGGCFALDASNQIIQRFSVENGVLQNNNVFSFAQGNDNKIWIASAGQGLYYFDFIQEKFGVVHNNLSPNEDLNSFRKCLFYDKNNTLWIGTEGDGLYLYDTQNNNFTHYKKGASRNIPSNTISDICQMADGTFWLSSDGDGLMQCHPSSMTFSSENYQAELRNGLNTNNLLKIFADKDNNVWIATFNGGVNIWKKYKTHFPNLKEWSKHNIELSNRSVLGICESRNNQIWFATDGAGLNVWDKNKQNWQHFSATQGSNNNFPSGNVAKSIIKDSKGNLWVGYFGKGLDCYNPNTEKNQHFQKDINNIDALSGENVWSLAEDTNGNIWIGTLDGGLNQFDPLTGKFKRYLQNPNISSTIIENSVFAILPDESGNVWVGTQNNGLDYLDPRTGIFTHFQNEENNLESISGNDIRCIFKDHKKRLWIGTESGGLNQWLGNGKFKRFNTTNGLLNNAIMSINEDDNGILWLSSFQGISRFDVDKMHVFNYNFHVSERNNQFNQLSSIKMLDGTLCFGGINGVNFIHPNQILENTLIPNVYISDFKVFNHSIIPNDGTNILTQSLDETKEINLSYTQNLFSFEFSALEFTNPHELNYAYILEGFDKEWRYVNGDERSVSYSSLSHGVYTFKVKASNSNGLWSDKITEIKIIIHPPFWKTIWFRLLIMLALVALAVWAFRIYTQRREEQWKAAIVEQEKEILRLQNEKLGAEIEGKTTELMSKALQMGHKNEVMQKLKDGFSELRKDQSDINLKKIKSLENIVNFELQDEDNWQQLNLYFDQVNHNFTEKLLKAFPHLTQNDLRVCILVKLNLSIKEMAALLNVSVQGIEKSKYRLKKRLNLNSEDDLTDFLRRF